jgi:hypothetical protein
LLDRGYLVVAADEWAAWQHKVGGRWLGSVGLARITSQRHPLDHANQAPWADMPERYPPYRDARTKIPMGAAWSWCNGCKLEDAPKVRRGFQIALAQRHAHIV